MSPHLTCNLRQATELLQIDPGEFEWCILEFGICETDDFTAWPTDGDDFVVCARPTR
jgi:hypothetical protein